MYFIINFNNKIEDNKHTIFGQVADQESQDVVNSILKNDLIENIEINGDVVSDPEVDEHLSEWNVILDSILI